MGWRAPSVLDRSHSEHTRTVNERLPDRTSRQSGFRDRQRVQIVLAQAGGPGAEAEEGLDHYAVGMKDPEGNEFNIN
jgi:hypothetical protein